MIPPRVMPCLLLRDKGLVKGTKFDNYRYVGDPINAVKIYNTKEVDELIFLDITATKEKRIPPIDMIEKIADECYMPFAVGGGIRTVEEARRLLFAGAEKISINTSAVLNPKLIEECAEAFGNQSVVVSIDVKRNWRRKYEIYTHSGTKRTKLDPVEFAVQMEKHGAGEIFLNSIDRDGSMEGYDVEVIHQVANAVSIPVIACGGAGNLEHLSDAVKKGGASAVAAGSFFVFHGRRRAVLINFPTKEELGFLFG